MNKPRKLGNEVASVPEPRKLKLVISYDGTDYFGWQIQPQGPSIQQLLANAIFKITGENTHPVGSGRTDAGVHALAQVAHFETQSQIPTGQFLRALNFHLPPTIVVTDVADVPTDFHARRDAIAKLYRYVINDGRTADVFTRAHAWRVKYPLDERLMACAAAELLGTHDFRCFETNWPNRKSSVRTITRADVSRLGNHVFIDVESNGFLYNMVRAIAGTLFWIGRGKWPLEKMRQILENPLRSSAGPNAPAHGLFLIKVTYPPEKLTAPSSSHARRTLAENEPAS